MRRRKVQARCGMPDGNRLCKKLLSKVEVVVGQSCGREAFEAGVPDKALPPKSDKDFGRGAWSWVEGDPNRVMAVCPRRGGIPVDLAVIDGRKSTVLFTKHGIVGETI